MIAALVAAVAIASPGPTPQATPAPQDIFDAAVTRLASYPLPPYAVWIDTRRNVASSFDPSGNVNQIVTMRYAVRISDGMENATDYPVVGRTLPQAMVAPQFQGPFAWSLRSRRAAPPTDEGLLPDVPQPLKTIAHVATYGPPSYAIDDAGVETIDGHRSYHLRLRPLSDADRHNLRELWIDASTYDVWKARFRGIYQPAPGFQKSPSDVLVTFAPIGPYWIVSHMQWTWNDYRGERLFHFDAERYLIGFPPSLPDWLFDAGAYERHRSAGDADYLDSVLNGTNGGHN